MEYWLVTYIWYKHGKMQSHYSSVITDDVGEWFIGISKHFETEAYHIINSVKVTQEQAEKLREII